ncbi:MAG TPA: ATP-dependent DNA helicase RecG [Methylomirabilota bacterium]|nr:ATP-dependent DNA helicase RecG [Methylomirabilota bacterium]
MPRASEATLDSPVRCLHGVGAERVAQLDRLEVRTIEDLLLHRPRRYEDRRNIRSIGDLANGESSIARGRVVALGVKRWKRGTRCVFELILEDGTGRLHCRWWNLPYMGNYFKAGDEVMVFGKVNSLKPRTMDHPETEIIEGGEEGSIHLNRIAPIYALTEGLPQRWLRGLLWRVLEQWADRVPEPCPELSPADLPARANALRMIHFPETFSDIEIARRRLALDEFTGLQLAIQRRRKRLQANARGLPCGGDNRLIRPFLRELKFKLTAGQTAVLRQIRADLGGGVQPMRRLLQGDVGSGKTVVAACAALMAIESGFDVALMAPTEILAEQHTRVFQRWFEPLEIPVRLRTGSRDTGKGEEDIARSGNTRPGILVGTHALIEKGVSLRRPGLVIIDEQHKFGVVQREKLVRKGAYPHLLVMTATPIPRTLGLTLYGDLDVSVIREAPAGRGSVRTFVRDAGKLPKVWAFLREQLKRGRQAYVVYPRVEENDRDDVKSVTGEWERVRAALAPWQVGLLHGRLESEEKERVIGDFRENRLHALVATSVIEVGIDVPNATVMLIENAEQFGLAQLHQLRGRIGRGTHASYCVLVGKAKTAEARARLRVMERTTDGFQIAEEDLKLRGPGELLGRQQSGLPRFRFGDLSGDLELVERARREVREFLKSEGGRIRAGGGATKGNS